MWRAFYTVVSPIRPSWHYNIQHMERRLTCLRHVWLLNGLEWNWLASPLKASRWTVTVCQNQPIDTHDWFSFGQSRPDYVNEICMASSHPTHTHQFAWWSFQYWLIIITVFHPGLWLRDSMTKAARTNCQRILGEQSKAFELMQRGNWGKSSSKSPCFYSVVTRSTSSPHSWCLISRFHSAFFPPSLTTKVKQINPSPMSRKHEQ